MTLLAPLSILPDHLLSSDADVRRTALQHVEAHGPAARSLAPEVARLLDDPDPAVSYFAMGAFRAIGSGMASATNVLVAHVSRADASPMLRSRSLFCLGVIGPSARDAIEPLLGLAERPELRGDVVEALVSIAPPAPEPRVTELVVDALFDPDASVRDGVTRALPDGPAWLVDRALELAQARADDADQDMFAMGIVLELTPRIPERVLPIAMDAILRDRPTAGLAMLALERAESAIGADVGRAMLRAAARGDERAAECIERTRERLPVDELAGEACALLVPRLLASPDAATAAAFAKALAALAPGTAEVVPALIETLRAGIDLDRPSFYRLGDLAEAIGALSDGAIVDRAVEALGDALARSRSHVRRDESAVLDFQRAVRRGLEPLERRSRRGRERMRVEADVVDAENARAAEERAQAQLPRIPAPRTGPAPSPRVSAPAHAALEELDRAREGGALVLARDGLDASAAPERIAELVDVEVRAMRREGRRELEAVPPLAALYGDALARELGWSWKLWTLEDVRALAVVAPHGTHAVLPGKLVRAKLEPGAEVTLLLLFRMLAAGRLPPSSPGALTLLA